MAKLGRCNDVAAVPIFTAGKLELRKNLETSLHILQDPFFKDHVLSEAKSLHHGCLSLRHDISAEAKRKLS